MLHAVLLVVAHDLLEYRYVDDVMGEGPEGGGSDPISQCYFMKNPIPI